MSELTDFYEGLCRAVSFLKIEITSGQADLFYNFYEDLVEKNRVMNLTAITDQEGVITKHFADSLSLVRVVPSLRSAGTESKADSGTDPRTELQTAPERSVDSPAGKNSAIQKVIDLGTGAGFPGIPLAILFPEIQFTLVDSLNKRILFLSEECEKLSLRNVILIHARAEELARKKEHREQYDLCVSRAVANLSTLSEYCIPFIHKNGYFIPYKSGNVDNELKQAGKALRILGGTVERTDRFQLPGDAGDRSLILIRKTRETPVQFPRQAGQPAKKPIL